MSMSRIVCVIRSLLRSTHGNGELVGVLVAVALAVGAGLIAMQTLGTSAKGGAGQLGGQVQSLKTN